MTKLLIKALRASGMVTVDMITVGPAGQLIPEGEISREMLRQFGKGVTAEGLLKKYRGDYLKVVREN